MYLGANDLEYWSKEIEQQLKDGNQWAVFNQDTFLTKLDDRKYFKTHVDAKEYCLDNVSDKDYFKSVAIEPLYKAMQQIYTADKDRKDVDYYVIDERDFEVSRVLKVNPDQNPLHNPDGNDFTEELISHMESDFSKEKDDIKLLDKNRIVTYRGFSL